MRFFISRSTQRNFRECFYTQKLNSDAFCFFFCAREGDQRTLFSFAHTSITMDNLDQRTTHMILLDYSPLTGIVRCNTESTVNLCGNFKFWKNPTAINCTFVNEPENI